MYPLSGFARVASLALYHRDGSDSARGQPLVRREGRSGLAMKGRPKMTASAWPSPMRSLARTPSYPLRIDAYQVHHGQTVRSGLSESPQRPLRVFDAQRFV